MTDRPTERRRIGTTKAAFLIEFSVRKGSAFGVSLPPSLTLAYAARSSLWLCLSKKKSFERGFGEVDNCRTEGRPSPPCGVWAGQLPTERSWLRLLRGTQDAKSKSNFDASKCVFDIESTSDRYQHDESRSTPQLRQQRLSS